VYLQSEPTAFLHGQITPVAASEFWELCEGYIRKRGGTVSNDGVRVFLINEDAGTTIDQAAIYSMLEHLDWSKEEFGPSALEATGRLRSGKIGLEAVRWDGGGPPSLWNDQLELMRHILLPPQ
jgi:hypothetical protein